MQIMTPVPRTLFWPASATWGKYVYLLGGRPSGSTTLIRDFYRYDTEQDTWTQLPDIPAALAGTSGMVAHALDGKIYATGDFSASETHPFSVYNITTGEWGLTAVHPGVVRCAMAVHNGQLYVYGGSTNAAVRDARLWRYDPAADAWTQLAPNTGNGVRDHGMAFLDGQLYVVGGDMSNVIPHTFTPRVFRYDTEQDTWTQLADLGAGRRHHAVFNLGGQLYAAGGLGSGSTGLASVEVYDPSTDSWSDTTPLDGARLRFGLGLTAFGYYVMGGNSANSTAAADTNWYEELYTPIAREPYGFPVWLNNFESQLEAPLDSQDPFLVLPAAAVTTLSGLLVGKQRPLLTLSLPSGASTPVEVVRVQATRDATSVWVDRGVESTLARYWPLLSPAQIRLTAGGLEHLKTAGMDAILVGAAGDVLTADGNVLTQE